MRALDLFCGAGGASHGLTQAGFEVTGIDFDLDACTSHEKAGHRTRHADIRDLDPAQFTPVDLLWASPPCQTYSMAGLGAGRRALDEVTELLDARVAGEDVDHAVDLRSSLVVEPWDWITTIWPQWVVFEQVPTVLPIWQRYARHLDEQGYWTWAGLLHSEQYGVPQTRKRAFLLASFDGPVGPPAPTHSRYYPRTPGRRDPGLEPWVSMAEALGWDGLVDRPAPTVSGGGTYTGGAEPFANAALRRRLFAGAGATSIDTAGQVRRDPEVSPAHTITGKWTAAWVHERPSTTVVSSRPDVQAAPGWRKAGDGPRQNASGSVRITVEEALVLQGFPPDYPLAGTKTSQFRQVGNACPPPLARACAEHLRGRT